MTPFRNMGPILMPVKESYEVGSDNCENMPNVWLPDEVLPGFRSFMTEFYWKCFGTAQNLLRALAVGIGLDDEDFLLKYHNGHNNQLRLLHYPPVEKEKLEKNSVARMPAHTDWGSITMLFQDDCGGLQVDDPHNPGKFVEAVPVKNAIIMNIGDLLMRWSNGKSPRAGSDNSGMLTERRLPQINATPGDGPASPARTCGREADDASSILDPILRQPGSERGD